MVHRRVSAPIGPPLDFDAIRAELEVPGPPGAAAEAEAAAVAARGPDPALHHADRTDLELVTIDPPGSRDLDQAVAVTERPEADGGGWRVHYAIADVAAWVAPGGAIDAEAWTRTQTYFAPDVRRPLHPPALGEDAASLVPTGPRPAALWTIDVAPDGTTSQVDLERAMVRSRAQLDYPGVQADLDAGRAHPSIAALPGLGAALLADARRRDAIELGLPDQEVVPAADGRWTVALRTDLPVEHWNAQVSLLTGRAAADLMVGADMGLLRTLPTPDPATFPRLQRAARSLGIRWDDGAHPGEVLHALDPARPAHAAFIDLAAELLRGAAYTALPITAPPGEGDPSPPDLGHAGVGARYAHVTAPLRRLADRFATEVCLAVVAGTDPPAWAMDGCAAAPEAMAAGDRLAHQLERALVDATEAFVLAGRVGETFPASVVETGDAYGTVVLDEPAVRGRCETAHLPLGVAIHVRCTVADVATRTVRFERVS